MKRRRANYELFWRGTYLRRPVSSTSSRSTKTGSTIFMLRNVPNGGGVLRQAWFKSVQGQGQPQRTWVPGVPDPESTVVPDACVSSLVLVNRCSEHLSWLGLLKCSISGTNYRVASP